MEIEKNIICVIKKKKKIILRWEDPWTFEFITYLRDLHFKSKYIPEVFALFIWVWSEKYIPFFLVIEKHRLVFKFLCIKQLQIECKFAAE